MAICLDHVTTYTDAVDHADHLAGYLRAGFPVEARTVDHAHGVRSGVIRYGDEYLEILGLADPDTFVASAPSNDKLMYAGVRPFGLGLKAPDLDAVQTRWVEAGHARAEISTLHAEASRGGPPVELRILPIALKALRGASCFVVEKATRGGVAPPAPNGTYAVAAVTMVSAELADRVAQWSALLGVTPAPLADDITTVPLGRQHARWTSPEAFARAFGEPWRPARHPLGEIAAVHLLSDDLAHTRATVIGAGRTVRPLGARAILVEAHPDDGLRLVVHAWPREAWAAWCAGHGPAIALDG